MREVQEETSSKDVDEYSESRRSKRTWKENTLGSDEIESQFISLYSVDGNDKNVIKAIYFLLQMDTDPNTYKEVMTSCGSIFWENAIKDKMDLIMSKNT